MRVSSQFRLEPNMKRGLRVRLFQDQRTQLPEESYFYPSLAEDAHPQIMCGKKGGAVIDWIASMLVRTRAFALMAQAVDQKESAFGELLCQLAPALMNNVLRISWFSELQDILSRPLFRWKV